MYKKHNINTYVLGTISVSLIMRRVRVRRQSTQIQLAARRFEGQSAPLQQQMTRTVGESFRHLRELKLSSLNKRPGPVGQVEWRHAAGTLIGWMERKIRRQRARENHYPEILRGKVRTRACKKARCSFIARQGIPAAKCGTKCFHHPGKERKRRKRDIIIRVSYCLFCIIYCCSLTKWSMISGYLIDRSKFQQNRRSLKYSVALMVTL